MPVACLKDKSIGSYIIEQIIELAKSLDKNHILDTIDIYGLSDKDGSATVSLEYIGKDSHEDILALMQEIKTLVINTKKEVKEQESPSTVFFGDQAKIIYRFRIWNETGIYEINDRELVEK